MRKAHVVDGAAMANFMAWLEDRIVVQGKSVSEVEIDEVLTGCRAEQARTPNSRQQTPRERARPGS